MGIAQSSRELGENSSIELKFVPINSSIILKFYSYLFIVLMRDNEGLF